MNHTLSEHASTTCESWFHRPVQPLVPAAVVRLDVHHHSLRLGLFCESFSFQVRLKCASQSNFVPRHKSDLVVLWLRCQGAWVRHTTYGMVLNHSIRFDLITAEQTQEEKIELPIRQLHSYTDPASDAECENWCFWLLEPSFGSKDFRIGPGCRIWQSICSATSNTLHEGRIDLPMLHAQALRKMTDPLGMSLFSYVMSAMVLRGSDKRVTVKYLDRHVSI